MTTVARSGSSARRAAAFDVVERDRPQQVRQAHVVVEAEAEELRGLQEVRDAGVGFERARHRADRGTAATRSAPSRVRPSRRSRASSSSIDAIGAIDVGRADAGADRRAALRRRSRRARSTRSTPCPAARGCCRRAGRRARTGRARCSSARARSMPGSRRANGREAVGDVGLRLVHHRDDDAAGARSPAATGGSAIGGGGGCRQPPNTRAGDVDARPSLDVADDDRRQLARREALGVQPHAAGRASGARRSRSCPSSAGRTDDRPGYSSAISDSIARTAGLSSSCRIAVITSPLRVASSASGSDGAITMSPSSASTGSKSSARQVQTSENRWRVTRDRQRDAAAVELFGDLAPPIASRCRDR